MGAWNSCIGWEMKAPTNNNSLTLPITTVARFDITVLLLSYILSSLLQYNRMQHIASLQSSVFSYAVQFIMDTRSQPLCHTSTMSKQLQLMENKIQSMERLCNPVKQKQTISLSLVQNSTELEEMHIELFCTSTYYDKQRYCYCVKCWKLFKLHYSSWALAIKKIHTHISYYNFHSGGSKMVEWSRDRYIQREICVSGGREKSSWCLGANL